LYFHREMHFLLNSNYFDNTIIIFSPNNKSYFFILRSVHEYFTRVTNTNEILKYTDRENDDFVFEGMKNHTHT